MRADFEFLTCVECLAVLSVSIDDKLRANLKAGMTKAEALERARTRLTMRGVESLVATS